MTGRREERFRFEEYTGFSVLKALLLAIPGLVLIVGSLWIALQFLDPMPPRKVVLAAGPKGSVLHTLALDYGRSMAADGIDVEVRETRGASENLALLTDPQAPVDLAFLFAGTATREDAKRIVNIATLFHVPLWCFVRGETHELALNELRGRRVAVGAAGTGLRATLAPLLASNDLTEDNTELLYVSTDEALRGLAAGDIDAVFIADGIRSPDFETALAIPGVRLVSFPRADAYGRLYQHLVHLTLPRGTLGLARDIPERELALIGTSTMIAARANVHPTVVDLVVDAARDLHGNKTIFDRRGEFPHLTAVDDVPMSEQAVLYARQGPSLLRRYLPLWAADALQRAFILAIPLVAITVPLIRVLPAVLDLLSRRHVLRGYAALRRIERTLRARPAGAPVDDLMRELHGIEDSIAGVKESVLKAGELYTLRVHLGVVRDAIARRMQPASLQAPVYADRGSE